MRAIWAQSRDGIIGDGQDMPWHLPEDLAHFKKTTLGAPVLMGRATWESIPEKFRPLPGRENFIVSTRQPGAWSAGGSVVSLDDPLPEGIWVMGGGQIYAATLSQVDHVVLTLIDVELGETLGEAAVYAPALAGFEVVSETEWLVSKKGKLLLDVPAEAGKPLRYKFQNLRRVTG